MSHRLVARPALFLALALPLAACGESATSPSTGAQTSILLSQSAAARASLAPSLAASVSALAGPVSLSDVASIDVTVTEVQALRQGAARVGSDSLADSVSADTARLAAAQRGWVSLKVTAPTTVNLLALPTTAESGIQLARGEIQPGTYTHLRVAFSEATITFARDVSVGGGPAAKSYAAGTAYPLQIGGEKKALLIPTAGFTVAADSASAVVVTFDGSASVRKVIATPNGIHITPVLAAEGKGSGKEKEKDKGKGNGKG